MLLSLSEALMRDKEGCAYVLESQRRLIFNTMLNLIATMCPTIDVNSLLFNLGRDPFVLSRVVPIETVSEFQGATLFTDLNLGKF